jgi:CheY-like chemotaxis protein
MRQSALEIEQPEFCEPAPVNEFLRRDETRKMLVVDDDPSVLRLLADHCAQLGFDVDTAPNGIQALLKASRTKPEILVIDVNMPEVDGLSVCAHLLGPDRRPLDVIVITGSRDPATPERCEGFGASYARKGPNFWTDLETALVEIDPQLAGRIRQGGRRDAPPQVRPRPRVLLVDDDEEISRFLTSRLDKCGVDLIYAPDATQGLRAACRDEPVAIVTDFFMPDGDARYFITKLRTTRETEKIPVIVLSGRQLNHATAQDLKRDICGHRGAIDVIRKSENAETLFDALKKICGFENGPRP